MTEQTSGKPGIELISCPTIARPGGHYSAAAAYGDLVFISGQLPIRLDGTVIGGDDFDAQAHQALDNFLTIAASAGTGRAGIVKVTAYIVGIENWPRFNRIYAERMGDHRPARAVVPVPELHYGCLIEMEGMVIRGL